MSPGDEVTQDTSLGQWPVTRLTAVDGDTSGTSSGSEWKTAPGSLAATLSVSLIVGVIIVVIESVRKVPYMTLP